MNLRLLKILQAGLVSLYVFFALHAGLVLADPAVDALPQLQNIPDPAVADAVTNGNVMDINIHRDRAILDFNSHDIGANATVNYNGNTNFRVLGKIHDQSASQIFGTLNSDVNLTLINKYGFIFGPDSVVNATSLTASALNSALPFDVNDPELKNSADFRTFAADQFDQAVEVYTGTIDIQEGAQITASEGGNLFFLAPQSVKNDGALRAKDGQVILAAGSKVYLAQPDASSNESNILVEVEITNDHINTVNSANNDDSDQFQDILIGHVENAVGEIYADRGAITLLGASVRNNGTLSANTSVKQGGKIRLLAGSNLENSIGSENAAALASVFDQEDLGVVTLGSDSQIFANPDITDDSTAVEADTQPRGEIELLGKKITFAGGSSTVARSGEVNIYNVESRNSSQSFQTLNTSDEEKYADFSVTVENGASINVSGLDTKTSVAKNFIKADLLSNELADSTLAKNNEALRDVLREGSVTIDARKLVEFDGEDFEGTALGDVSGFIDLIEYNVAERSVFGGDINIESRNVVDIHNNARLNVSGGSIEYTPDNVITTKLIEQGTNRIIDIGDARPDRNYSGLLDMNSVAGRRIINSTPEIAGYVDGKSAGALSINAEQILSPLTASNIVGEARVGDFQTQPGLSLTQSNRPSLARFTPLGSSLVLGNSTISSDNFRAFAARLSNVTFDRTFTSTVEDIAQISTDLFATSSRNGERYINFTQLDVTASDTVSVNDNLLLPGNAEIDFTARVINALADIRSASGTVNFEAMESADGQLSMSPAINITSGSQINLSGSMINRNVDMLSIASIDGGDFSIEYFGDSDGSLTIASGAQIDVSGGVEFERNLTGLQDVNPGKGGSISIDVTLLGQGADDNVTISNAVNTFRGFGVTSQNQVSRGGSFKYKTDDYLCLSASACEFDSVASNAANIETFAPAFFSQTGFSQFDLQTLTGELVINDRLALTPIARQIQVSGNGFSTSLTQPAALFAQPVTLALSSARQFVFNDNASISTTADSIIDFESDNSMYLGGAITARSGNVSFDLTGNSVNNPADNGSFDNSIALWFGDNALIDVGSTALTRRINGLNTGRVFDSGSVNARSQRGYIIVEEGARILSNGISATIDQQNLAGGFDALSIATSGGDITLSAGERIFVSSSAGNFSVNAGSSQTAGGSLSFILDPSARGANSGLDSAGSINLNNFPLRHAQFLLTSDSYNPFANINNLAFGTPIETVTGQNGAVATGIIAGDGQTASTIISSQLVSSSGADNLLLKSVDVFLDESSQNQLPALRYRQGQIVLDEGLDFNLDGVLTLNASELMMTAEPDATARINAHAVRIGSSNNNNDRVFPGFNEETLSPAFAQVFDLQSTDNNQLLEVNAGIIDIFGESVINNIQTLALNSDTDIRLIGIPQENATGNTTSNRSSDDLIGSLQMQDVQLNLSARQIYPSTLTDFTLSNTGDDASINITSPTPGITPVTPYSAAGELDIITRRLAHGGVLRAPEGAIRLMGDDPNQSSIEVLADGIVSVSANGAVIPFAQTLIDQFPIVQFQGEQYIQSGLVDANGTVSGSILFDANNIQLLQEKQIELSANTIDLQDQSQLDLSGGGVMLTSQFNRGLLGTKNITRSTSEKNTFALAPLSAVNALAAPVDPSIPAGFDAAFGETVTLENSAGGLAAGTYIKLPAEYALLPGHVLAEEVSGFEGIQAQDVITQLDGSVVVAGSEGTSNGRASTTALKAFKIQDRGVINRRASYSTFSVGELVENVIQPNVDRVLRTTLDGGRLQLAAGDRLFLDGNIFADELDISSTAIRIVDDTFNQNPQNTLVLKDSQISDLQVDSILLGGQRFSANDGATGINVNTQSVAFDSGIDLNVSELIVVAKGDNGLLLGEGSSIVADSDKAVAQARLLAPGEGSLLAVSGMTDWQVTLPENPQTSPANRLRIEENASLNGAASIVIGSVNEFAIADNASISVADGTFSLVAPEISIIGDNADIPVSGSRLNAQTLSLLNANKVSLLASNQINLLGQVQVQRDNLAIQTNTIEAVEGIASSASNSIFNIAGQLELGGVDNAIDGINEVTASTGSVAFVVNSDILLTGGTVNFDGFSADQSVNFDSSLIQVTSDTGLNLPGGLSMNTGKLHFGIGNDLTVTAQGNADFNQSSQTIAQNIDDSLSPSLFGQFVLDTNGDVNINTDFALNSGLFEVRTNGADITLGEQTRVDLSGRSISVGGETFPTEGGWMILDSAGGNIRFSQSVPVDQSTVNLDGAQDADAGVMGLFAAGGDVDLNQNISAQSEGGRGGLFSLDEGEITADEFNTLNPLLNDQGFTGQRLLRTRTGDFNVIADQEIMAEHIQFIADQGNITIGGTLTADSAFGGYIGLFAGQNVNVDSGALLSARLLSDDEFARSQIELSSRAGTVDLNAGSQVQLSRHIDMQNAGNGGDLHIIAARSADDVAVQDIASTITGQQNIFVKGLTQYEASILDEALVTTIKADIDAFAGSIDAIEARLSASGNAVTIIPRVEVLSEDSLAVADNLKFNDWRYGSRQVAPEFVLAAAGDIEIGSDDNPVILSDGVDENLAILDDEFSTSFTVVAGSDLDSADIRQTRRNASDLASFGSIIIAEGRAAIEGGGAVEITAFGSTVIFDGSPFDNDPFNPATLEDCLASAIVVAGLGTCGGGGESTPLQQAGLRTGTGDINLYAAGNINFGNELSGVYTTGRQVGEENTDFFTLEGIGNLAYGEQGGNVRLSAGNNIVGAVSESFVNDWIWKTDQATVNGNIDSGTAGWAANPATFTGDIATLGGGNVTVQAGNDLSQLDISIASIGKQVGAAQRTQGPSQVEVVAGGNLNVSARGDIEQPKLYVGKGRGVIDAKGAIGDTETGGAIVMLGDAQIALTARDDLTLERVFNPTILLASRTQREQVPTDFSLSDIDARFFTYSDRSAVEFTSNTGELRYDTNNTYLRGALGIEDASSNEISTMPGNVSLTALNKSLMLGQNGDRLIMFPNSRGNFDFAAAGDILIDGVITQLDLPDNLIPTANTSINIKRSPNGTIQNESISVFESINDLLGYTVISNRTPDRDIETYRLRVSNRHAGIDQNGFVDNQNSRLLTNSSIIFSGKTDIGITTAEATDLIAGINIVNPNIQIQNANEFDISTLSAAGSVSTSFRLDDSGDFVDADTFSGIFVDGPGRLDVITGDQINLGASQGILSRGNTFNSVLSPDPAQINILAGFTNFDQRVGDFVDAYINVGVDQSVHDPLIRQFLSNLSLSASQTYGTLISDSSDIGEYQSLSQQALASPFLNLSAQQLQQLDQLSEGGSLDSAQLGNIFLSLDEQQQFDVVLQAFNNEIFTGGQAAVLATDIGLGTAGFYAGYQQSFRAIRTLFPEHAGALDLLQQQIGSNSGLVGVDTSNAALVGFVTELNTALAQLPDSRRESVINQIQANIAEGTPLSTAINAPLANNSITDSNGALIQVSDGVTTLVDNASNVEGSDIADFVQSLQRNNDQLFFENVANVNTPFNLVGGEVGGDINVLVPFGFYNVGGNIDTTELGLNRTTGEQGIISGGGSINMFLGGDLIVNLQRVVGIGDEQLNLFSLFDNIDAGSGAKTAIAVSPATFTFDRSGQRQVTFAPSFAGSGIRKLEDDDGNLAPPGLFTPFGIVDAGDAGIVSDAGISIAALDVQNDTQISQGGQTGATSAPAAPVTPTVDAGASNAATNSASNDAVANESEQDTSQSFASEAAAFLDVFVVGVGDEEEENDRFDSASANGINRQPPDNDEQGYQAPGCRPDENGVLPENCLSSL